MKSAFLLNTLVGQVDPEMLLLMPSDVAMQLGMQATLAIMWRSVDQDVQVRITEGQAHRLYEQLQLYFHNRDIEMLTNAPSTDKPQ